jgi:hypothetical protein
VDLSLPDFNTYLGVDFVIGALVCLDVIKQVKASPGQSCPLQLKPLEIVDAASYHWQANLAIRLLGPLYQAAAMT